MLFRISESGRAAFQLRKGEDGVSVFDSETVQPALTQTEVLSWFRPGSVVVERSKAEMEAKGLKIIRMGGATSLPPRLREAHAEVQAGSGMSRAQFKRILQEIE